MIRFSVIGITHGHIYGQVRCLLNAGATFVAWHAYAHEAVLMHDFAQAFPHAQQVADESAILEDASVHLIVTATIPSNRAALGVHAMQHGKDVMTDKPGCTTLAQLAQLRRVQASTGRIYSVCYSERLENRATTQAGALVQAGAIGKVLQTIGIGLHRLNSPTRLPYFFQRESYGGILCDIGSHQFDQFLFFTGSTQAEIVAAQVGNLHHPEHAGLDDFGDAMVRGNGGTGYVRLDWFTPDGLPVWGDGRLTILGTEGYIELRKYIDIAGRNGGDHLFITDRQGTRYLDCSQVPLPYGEQLIHDIINRTETAMSQTHCFLASELALNAQAQATVLTGKMQ